MSAYKPTDRRIVMFGLQVADMDASLHFYRDFIGIPLRPGANEPAGDPWTGGAHAEYSWTEGGALHLALFPARVGSREPTTQAQVCFTVPNVKALHALRPASIKVLHAPRPEPWGLTARYEDPDGNIVAITSH